MGQHTNSTPLTADGRWLPVPEVSWHAGAEVVIVGSGVAGLTLAHSLLSQGLQVALVTKTVVRDGSTPWAQGGVASADGSDDDPRAHWYDTLVAGAGLCDPDAVWTLVTQGPAAVARLLDLGADFDKDSHGQLTRTLEGGHGYPRIVHAGGDATGWEIQTTMEAAVLGHPNLVCHEYTFLLDLLRDTVGTVTGIRVAKDGSVGEINAAATVLATGGYGQLYASTTSPAVCTGDGLAAAIRAGAAVADLEFMQFHPTALFTESEQSIGQRRALISEAVRGEGAYLLDAAGTRFMVQHHPKAELAPRDVVASGMAQQMAATGSDRLYLDARHLGQHFVRRFPTITDACRQAGIDPVRDLIPVAPAAHYSCGGIVADMDGATTLPGLYAIGEVACTGVHGANRLASNSLLEGMVMARRLGDRLAAGHCAARAADSWRVAAGEAVVSLPLPTQAVDPRHRLWLTSMMASHAGVLRAPDRLQQLADVLAEMPSAAADQTAGVAAWEMTNLHTIGMVMVAAAQYRSESRGAHRRTDFAHRDPLWRHRLVATAHGGTLTVEHGPLIPDISQAEARKDADNAAFFVTDAELATHALP